MTVPNAWLLLASRFGELLDLVYKQNQGEIWLFNNDLYVIGHPGLFKDLYWGMLDHLPLRAHVRCVKLLLSKERLKEFKDPNSPVYANLCSLSEDRLKTFYVGSVENAQPGSENDLRHRLGVNPWVFYTVDGTLQTAAAQRGLVLVRQEEYPFVIKDNPNEPQLAVCWRVQDATHETVAIKSRISWAFDQWFMRLSNFESIEPILESGKVKGLNFVEARDAETIASIVSRMGNEKVEQVYRRPVETVDFGVVTALEDEAEEVETRLNGIWPETRGDQIYRLGHYRTPSGRTYWVAVCRHAKMGSVPAALTTANLIRDLKPKYVVLLGIAGGRSAPAIAVAADPAVTASLTKGDVVYATAISPYEYEKREVVKDSDGKEEQKTSREDRTMPCSTHLVQLADMVRRSWKGKPPNVPGRPAHFSRTSPAAFGGTVACGCKVIADETVLSQLDALQPSNRKLIAIEMEGEGVGEAAHQARTEFILIKGISDLANREKKDDEWRTYAARVATQFFFDMLDSFPEDQGRS